MDREMIEMLIKPVCVIIGMLLTAYVIPWLKQKIGTEKLTRLTSYAEIAVRAAEQIYSDEEFKLKKSYVLSYLVNKSYEMGMNVTTEDLDNLIESTVNYIKYGMEYNREK